jgi:hypothetical protein
MTKLYLDKPFHSLDISDRHVLALSLNLITNSVVTIDQWPKELTFHGKGISISDFHPQ